MIHWLVQRLSAHPGLAAGQVPEGLLGRGEKIAFSALSSLRRKQDWLLGRWTAKQLLCEVLRAEGYNPTPEAIVIDHDQRGAPVVHLQLGFVGKGQLWEPDGYTLSISHSDEHAFCAVKAGPGAFLGADIERIERRPEQLVAAFFTEEERAALGKVRPDHADMLVTATWSAKEAALKALRVGLRGHMSAVSCPIRPVSTAPQKWTPFSVKLWGASVACSRSLPALTGLWRTTGRYVLALVFETAGHSLKRPELLANIQVKNGPS